MLAMRMSVMELGRFTLLGWSRRPAGFQFDYAPTTARNAMHGWLRTNARTKHDHGGADAFVRPGWASKARSSRCDLWNLALESRGASPRTNASGAP
jgi:hypothetical protein